MLLVDAIKRNTTIKVNRPSKQAQTQTHSFLLAV